MEHEFFVNLDYNHSILKKKEKTEIKYNLNKFSCGESEITFPEKENKIYYKQIAEGTEKKNTKKTEKTTKKDNPKNDTVYIYQSFTREKFNDDLMKLFIVCSILNKNYTNITQKKLNIIYIAPFLPYTRQKESSILLKNIFQICEVKSVITYDLHYHYNDNNYSICPSGPKKLLVSAMPLFIKDIKKQYKNINEIIIVFPDKGAKDRFFSYFKHDFTTFCLEKIRSKNNNIKIVANDDTKYLRDKNAIIVDDMIDTGKTVIKTASFLIKNNVKSIDIYATHGVFSSNSIKELNKNKNIKSVVISDSIKCRNIKSDKLSKKFRIIKLNPSL